MSYFYSVAFVLLSCAMFPGAGNLAHVYLLPKVLILLILGTANIVFSKDQTGWKEQLVSWSPWLLASFLATLFAYVPLWSFLGYPSTYIGLAWWLLLFWFTSSNTLLLKQKPTLFRFQFWGLQVGTAINAIIAITQKIISQDPHAFFAHSAILAGFIVFSLASLITFSNLLPKKTVLFLSSLYISVLVISGIRTTLLVLPVLFIGWIGWKKTLPILLVSLLLVAGLSTTRQIQVPDGIQVSPQEQIIKNLTSDRVWLYERAIIYIKESPLIGHGFHGLHIRRAIGHCRKHGGASISYESYICQDETRPLELSYHSYNLFLDRLIESGFLGLMTFSWLFYRLTRNNQNRLFLLAYLIYTSLWFDSAAYTWMFFWMHSVQQDNSIIAKYDNIPQ